jgi:prepilin-type N-terminal cleavage/methylation domain-containing protein
MRKGHLVSGLRIPDSRRHPLRGGGEGTGEIGAESGFTLIEMMTVLLIMAVLLAIALPTFFSVTNGAKKTAAQSNLSSALSAAQAVWSTTESFGTTLKTTLQTTQRNIKFVTKTTAVTKGPVNAVGVDVITKTWVVLLTAVDARTTCWVAELNLKGVTVSTKYPAGTWYWAKRYTTAPTTHCKPATVATTITATATWKTSFKATGVKT